MLSREDAINCAEAICSAIIFAGALIEDRLNYGMLPPTEQPTFAWTTPTEAVEAAHGMVNRIFGYLDAEPESASKGFQLYDKCIHGAPLEKACDICEHLVGNTGRLVQPVS